MRCFRLVAVSLLFVALTVHVSASRGRFQIDESRTRLSFENGEPRIDLTIENPQDRTINARIGLEIVDANDKVRATATHEKTIRPGWTTVRVPLNLTLNSWRLERDRDLPWYRLRYSLKAHEGLPEAVTLTSGVVAISRITPGLFELTVVGPQFLSGGSSYRAQVRAMHPDSSHAVEGVEIQAKMFLQDSKALASKASALTDRLGYAVIDLEIPPAAEPGNATLKISGLRDGFQQEIEGRVLLDTAPQISPTTDKVIYQPGQLLHARALMVDSNKRAVGNKTLTLTIEDPEQTIVYRTTATTSRFGIAAVDWKIPANARLGDYSLRFDIDSSDQRLTPDSLYSPTRRVKISRYELPNFTVSVKPDRTYYLPGQNAEVEVRADYLFGRLLTKGHVRVVREMREEWNSGERKWERKEAETHEGELDSNGRFITRIDLSVEGEELKQEDYRRFSDVPCAAYLTDPTTGRTEQRRFELRITREPIHVYLISHSRLGEEGPVDFYISTCYADGEPARCEVAVCQTAEEDDSTAKNKTRAQVLRTVQTNRYGVAKISRLILPSDHNDWELSLFARDRRGLVGHHTAGYLYWQERPIQVETDKTIYRKGEPIEIRIESSVDTPSVFVDLAQNWRLIRSEKVVLKDGKGRLVVPYSDHLKDEVTIVAYNLDPNSDDDSYHNSHDDFEPARRTVLYPRKHRLQLDVRMNRDSYQPGEDAVADFRVRTADGNEVESSLGVAVIDQAVDERARTDTEFGSYESFYSWYSRMWYDGENIAGLTRSSLDSLDISKPISADIDLAAEILLRDRGYRPEKFSNDSYRPDLRHLFSDTIERRLKPLKDALAARYSHTGQYPQDNAQLQRIMDEFGMSLKELRDPWGHPYIVNFFVDKSYDHMNISSAGPDGRPDTADDFTAVELSWPYFKPAGQLVDRAAAEYHQRTGGYIRDVETFKRELRRHGINFDSLRDRWGKPYRLAFGIERTWYLMSVRSSGRNRRFESNPQQSDDFNVWNHSIDYTTELRSRIERALDRYSKATSRFPQTEDEFADAINRSGISLEDLIDHWGNRYDAVFHTHTRETGRVIIQSQSRYKEDPQQKPQITPVTERVHFIYLWCAGSDGKKGSPDDFSVAVFSHIIASPPAEPMTRPKLDDRILKVAARTGTVAQEMGTISGFVQDSQGAVVFGARVRATSSRTGLHYETKTGDDGRYILLNIPVDLYEVRFEAPGFSAAVIVSVPVAAGNITELNSELHAGAVSETVTVSAGAAEVMTISASSVDQLVSRGRGGNLTVDVQTEDHKRRTKNVMEPENYGGAMIVTPRLREQFPETLLWQPALETDASGRARLNFKLADNITTWKMSVIASTLDGQIGEAETKILAFQPFFIEHDPPRILTEGDQIALPVVVRNYLAKPQSVDLTMSPAPWFKLLSDSRKRVEVLPGDSAREVFEFQAVGSIDAGNQRVTAIGKEASDAIVKPVNVHPDGEEVTHTQTQIISGTASLETIVPDDAITGSTRVELKIYPNLAAHLIEGIEAIMRRPYGCAEQTISSAYPSLLLLRHQRPKGEEPDRLVRTAQNYVQSGYDRLLNYRGSDGGFSYWGRGSADTALTAYALKFLIEARDFIAVDIEVIRETRTWLLKQQLPSGCWAAGGSSGKPDPTRTALLTAYIARVLAQAVNIPTKDDSDVKENAEASQALTRALGYLSKRLEETDEPYFIASYALAATGGNDSPGRGRALTKLRALARNEASGTYWSLETNTPFYGWGLTGRLETTALVVQALASDRRTGTSNAGDSANNANEDLLNRALTFLLRQKDRYGVWHSTQATVNVLDALMTALHHKEPLARSSSLAQVVIGGQNPIQVEMPAAGRSVGPISVDLSKLISTGKNRIEVRLGESTPQASAQVVTSYWQPWSKNAKAAEPSHLRLQVGFDRTNAKIGEIVTCSVNAERVDSNGYGMLLAEIGLPPGADVDRESLEQAMIKDWSLQQYDVLPDRIVVYLWPRTGGVKFDFKFKPRFGLNAQTAPSLFYDYYNPEARTLVAPTRFTVK